MSLADELFAALENDGAEEETVRMEAEVDEVDIEYATTDHSIHSIAKLLNSDRLKKIVGGVKHFSKDRKTEICGPAESDPEYQLIVESNNIVVEITNEINLVHNYVRELYNKRFPELESLVQTPIEYVSTVKELGNNLERLKNNEVIGDFLSPATVMVVNITASTTQGKDLSTEDAAMVSEACDMAIELCQVRGMVLEYVESRMSFIAPNLSAIIGASTAAKLMGIAGGLSALSRMPACNVMLLGAQRRALSGFSTKTIIPHTGFIHYCDIIQHTPPELRKKAGRLVAAKCSMASRVDSFHTSTDGSVGEGLRNEVIGKLEKLQEPAPVKPVKRLPAPIDVPRKRRGGRRHRKMKERLGLTEMRKAANRMSFGEIEEDIYQADMSLTLGGMRSKSGHLRELITDTKTKARISKTLQQKIQKQQQWGGSTSVKKQVSGTASSVAFTPQQGLEIINPHSGEAKNATVTDKYFSASSTFLKINK